MYPAAYKRLTFLSRLVVWYSIPVNADVSDRITALPGHIAGVSLHRVDAAIFYPFYQSDVISSAITVPKGFTRTDARIIPILPVMLCKREYTAVAGAMILLIEISNAKNIAETSSFSTKIMPLANSNLERFTGIENTE